MRLCQSPAFASRVLLSAVLLAPVTAGAQTPTFAKDVAPIFYSKCVECHRPTMFAPMSLVKFDDARPWAKSIRNRVATRTMPPWGADPAHGVFKNDPRLTDKEIATILAWVDGGAPKGDDKDMPKLPEFADGWTIGKPDAVFEMKETFKIPATGTIEYQYIRIPTGITEDKWLAAIEIKPQARAHVHHVIAFTRAGRLADQRSRRARPRQHRRRHAEQARRGVRSRRRPPADRQHRHRAADALHDQRRGRRPTRPQVGAAFLKEPPQWQQRGGSVIQPRFVIPAGAPAHEVRGSRVLQADTIITSFTPHMHMRGKDMTYTAKYPDGRTETLLSVPK